MDDAPHVFDFNYKKSPVFQFRNTCCDKIPNLDSSQDKPSFSSRRSLIRMTLSWGSISTSISLPVNVLTLISIAEYTSFNTSKYRNVCIIYSSEIWI